MNRTFETATRYANTPVHLRRLRKMEQVVGSGRQEASATFDYDVGTPLSASGTCWEDPLTSYRGNLTATKRQCSGRDVTTSRTGDVLGNVRSLTEPLDSGEDVVAPPPKMAAACRWSSASFLRTRAMKSGSTMGLLARLG